MKPGHTARKREAAVDETALLDRQDFKRLVFQRAGGRCVFCDLPAVDAHHILERKLFADGGYHLGNGAAVCDVQHWDCETTRISVEAVRSAAGIQRPTLPEFVVAMGPGAIVDKWGNRIWPSGLRSWGPLEYDDGARRALAAGGFLSLILPSEWKEET